MDEIYTFEIDNHTSESQGSLNRYNNPADLPTWERVDSKLRKLNSADHHSWWNHHVGKALAVLLYNSGHPLDLQYRDLEFFAQVVAPKLGVAHERVAGSTPPWPSFITDDGTPIELS